MVIIEGHTCTNAMTAQSSITLPNSKVHFSTVLLTEVLKETAS